MLQIQGHLLGAAEGSGVELPASVGRYVEAGLQGAANTKRGYAAGLRSFENYCQHYQFGYLPAEVTTVAGYVWQLAELRYLMRIFVVIGRTGQVAFAELHPRATRIVAADFLRPVLEKLLYKACHVLANNGE